MMTCYLQAGFGGEPIDPAVLATLKARAFDGCRIDIQSVTDPTAIQNLVANVHSAGLGCTTIITGTSQLGALNEIQTPLDLELRNEPDLEGPGAEEYALLVRDALQALGPQHRLWIGAVSNLNDRGFAYLDLLFATLAQMRLLDHQFGVSVHRYPPKHARPTTAHKGFGSREEEVARLKRMIRTGWPDRPWIVTEYGYHTAREFIWGFWPVRWTNEDVAQFTLWEWDFWQREGATQSTLYQINDGPGSSREDRYGIRTYEGLWKPVSWSVMTHKGIPI